MTDRASVPVNAGQLVAIVCAAQVLAQVGAYTWPALLPGFMGHEDNRVKFYGHGVGLEVHEPPHFRDEPGEEGVLQVGDLVTLEPGLYDPDEGWAVRLEDLVHLTKEGARNLTPLPYDLDPRAWTR